MFSSTKSVTASLIAIVMLKVEIRSCQTCDQTWKEWNGNEPVEGNTCKNIKCKVNTFMFFPFFFILSSGMTSAPTRTNPVVP